MNPMKIKPHRFKGTRDILPEDMLNKERLLEIIRRVFKAYGFSPIETPAFEYKNILEGKYGEESEKLFYRLAYKGGKKLALRYDLTVPLARFVAMHQNEITFPFKRYQIQTVWRAEKAQLRQGRFREFLQCDVDTVGTSKLTADAEIIALTVELMKKLGIKNTVTRINHRKLLKSMVASAGYSPNQEVEVLRILDKLDKIGKGEVKEKLTEVCGDKSKADKLLELTSLDFNNAKLSRLEGVDELRELKELLHAYGVPSHLVAFDFSLARGLDYYTGIVFETKLKRLEHIGSLSGGGRYDNLIGIFAGRQIPAVGTTIGIDRIITAMEQLKLMEDKKTLTQILFVDFDKPNLTRRALLLVSRCREEGLAVEFYQGRKGKDIKGQLGYANDLGIPLVAFIGDEEFRDNSVQIKNMQTGEQVIIPQENLVARVTELIKSLEV